MTTLSRCWFFSLAILVLALASLDTAAESQTFSVLYNFGTNSGDPLNPGVPGLVAQGRDGNLYSTTSNGGTQGAGTVFKITPTGKLTVLYNFDGTHGRAPLGGLALGTDGTFYGTTWYGGTYDNGTIFRISAGRKLTVLYSFTGGNDGFQPYAPPDSSFYGTTELGATNNLGEVFRITDSGALTVLSEFDTTDGGNPYAQVTQGMDGGLYGTASGWGSSGWGTIYKVTPTGVFTDLYNFNGNSDGGGPYAGLEQGTDRKFYGAASGGGFNDGTIYSITDAGNFSVVHDFDGIAGSDPTVTLLQHTSGLLYGDTTCGGTGATGGCVYGNGGGVFYSLDVGLGRFVSLLPYSGKVGKTIEFIGQGFKGTTAVSFNGTPAKFTVKSETYLTAIAPEGATTGFVTVVTPSGKLKSNKQFRVVK
jgi:uncharacterized repeat protein (TIGR03803 family)